MLSFQEVVLTPLNFLTLNNILKKVNVILPYNVGINPIFNGQPMQYEQRIIEFEYEHGNRLLNFEFLSYCFKDLTVAIPWRPLHISCFRAIHVTKTKSWLLCAWKCVQKCNYWSAQTAAIYWSAVQSTHTILIVIRKQTEKRLMFFA